MKKLLPIVLSLVCVAATAQTPEQEISIKKEAFKFGIKLGCNATYPDSAKRCECESDVITEIMPLEVIENYKTDPAAKERARNIMRENQERIAQCSKS